ncbi:lysyl oxidase homolog 4-like [Saccoglossus kowalevskii]
MPHSVVVILGIITCIVTDSVNSVYDRDDVYLAEGNHPFEGRVTVRYRDEWTRVCIPNFDLQVADVVCRDMLGISTGAIDVWQNPLWIKDTHAYLPSLSVDCMQRSGPLADCMTSPEWCYSDNGVRCNRKYNRSMRRGKLF